jgi:hypothetical protein
LIAWPACKITSPRTLKGRTIARPESPLRAGFSRTEISRTRSISGAVALLTTSNFKRVEGDASARSGASSRTCSTRGSGVDRRAGVLADLGSAAEMVRWPALNSSTEPRKVPLVAFSEAAHDRVIDPNNHRSDSSHDSSPRRNPGEVLPLERRTLSPRRSRLESGGAARCQAGP